MPDVILRVKLEALAKELLEEAYNDPDLLSLQNPHTLQTQIDTLYTRIEQDRIRLQQAMHIRNSIEKINTIKGILSFYSSLPLKKLLLDEPYYLIFLLSLDTHPTKDLIAYLLDIYKEIDPTKSILKAALTFHPDMLQIALSKICPDTLTLLLNAYKEVGCLEKILFTPKHEVFTAAANAQAPILQSIIAAYKEADPTLKELSAALLAHKSQSITSLHYGQPQLSDETEKTTLLLTLYQEFNTGTFGMFNLFGWQYAFDAIANGLGNCLQGGPYFLLSNTRSILINIAMFGLENPTTESAPIPTSQKNFRN